MVGAAEARAVTASRCRRPEDVDGARDSGRNAAPAGSWIRWPPPRGVSRMGRHHGFGQDVSPRPSRERRVPLSLPRALKSDVSDLNRPGRPDPRQRTWRGQGKTALLPRGERGPAADVPALSRDPFCTRGARRGFGRDVRSVAVALNGSLCVCAVGYLLRARDRWVLDPLRRSCAGPVPRPPLNHPNLNS
jgi:hypothetical protein